MGVLYVNSIFEYGPKEMFDQIYQDGTGARVPDHAGDIRPEVDPGDEIENDKCRNAAS